MTAIFQVDAFASEVFRGNPAAVIPLTEWPDDALLQSIAEENNLAETAFIVSIDGQWHIRWFTPAAEVALCGHATLAAAHVIFQHLGTEGATVEFSTRWSGTLSVSRSGEHALAMSFPAVAVTACDQTDAVLAALGRKPSSLWQGAYSADQFDIVAVFDNSAEVAALAPDASKFAALGSRGVIATAPGGEQPGHAYDFVSRYFAPAFGIPEDPVTGSAHCLLTPFWAQRLGKTELRACQISPRTGELDCHLRGDRVKLIGQAIDYMRGTLFL